MYLRAIPTRLHPGVTHTTWTGEKKEDIPLPSVSPEICPYFPSQLLPGFRLQATVDPTQAERQTGLKQGEEGSGIPSFGLSLVGEPVYTSGPGTLQIIHIL